MSALGGLDVLRGGGIRSAWRASLRRRDRGTLSGVYLVKHGCLGSLGLESSHDGGLAGVAVEGV